MIRPIPIAILATMRDESPYVEEWIRWHVAVGIKRFYLYLNDVEEGNETYDVVNRVAGELSIDVAWTPWPGEQQQYEIYRHGIGEAMRDGVEWLAIIDVDEFLQPAAGTSVLTHLPDDATCVEVKWAMYGTSNRDHADLTQPVVGRFTFRQGDPHHLCKSIVRPEAFKDFVEVHHLRVEGTTVEAPFESLRCNHYWTKSREECAAKFKRGRADIAEHRQWDEFVQSEVVLNERRDLSAWYWLDLAGYQSSIGQSAGGPIDFQWHLRHDTPDVH